VDASAGTDVNAGVNAMSNRESLIARKSWLRDASIALWTKAEREAAREVYDAAYLFCQAQRRAVAADLRRIHDDSPGTNTADKIEADVLKTKDWEKLLRDTVGVAVVKTVARGYLAAKAAQVGRRRRQAAGVWGKGGPGSGNFGHAGRPGMVGGSAAGEGGGTSRVSWPHGGRKPDTVYRIQPQGANLHGQQSETSNGEVIGGVFVFDNLNELAAIDWMNEPDVELVEIRIEPGDTFRTFDQEGTGLRQGRGQVVGRIRFDDVRAAREWAVEEQSKDNKKTSRVDARKFTKQGWSDAPLTDAEEAEILSFELPPSVTRRVFAHSAEIISKPYWKDVTQTGLESMKWSIQEGIEEGKTLKQIADDIQGDIDSDKVRARRIATTEVSGAYAAGALTEAEEAEAAGVRIAKTWITIGDDKVRPQHEDMDGTVVEGAAGLFNVDGVEVPYPAHPDLPAASRCNCRCTMSIEPILEGETAAQHIEAYKAIREAARWLKFDPDQPRDPDGKWSGGGSYHAVTRDSNGTVRHSDGKVSKELTARAKALRLPPAWTDLKMSADPKNALQATGKDAKSRTQYVYSAAHSERAAAEKFGRVKRLIKELPAIDKSIRRDASTKDEAAVLLLMRKTGIRIGSERDTKAEKQAYGASTLRAEHVKIAGDKVTLAFTGKKGVDIRLEVKDKELVEVLRSRMEKGGKLFDTDDTRVRDYMHSIDGKFKPKDLRTIKAADVALQTMKGMSSPKSQAEFKKFRNAIGDAVAAKLGNTRAVALASYVPPEVFSPWKAKLGI